MDTRRLIGGEDEAGTPGKNVAGKSDASRNSTGTVEFISKGEGAYPKWRSIMAHR